MKVIVFYFWLWALSYIGIYYADEILLSSGRTGYFGDEEMFDYKGCYWMFGEFSIDPKEILTFPVSR